MSCDSCCLPYSLCNCSSPKRYVVGDKIRITPANRNLNTIPGCIGTVTEDCTEFFGHVHGCPSYQVQFPKADGALDGNDHLQFHDELQAFMLIKREATREPGDHCAHDDEYPGQSSLRSDMSGRNYNES